MQLQPHGGLAEDAAVADELRNAGRRLYDGFTSGRQTEVKTDRLAATRM